MTLKIGQPASPAISHKIDSNSQKLQTFLKGDRQHNAATLGAWMESKGVNVSISDFLADKSFAPQRAAAARELTGSVTFARDGNTDKLKAFLAKSPDNLGKLETFLEKNGSTTSVSDLLYGKEQSGLREKAAASLVDGTGWRTR